MERRESFALNAMRPAGHHRIREVLRVVNGRGRDVNSVLSALRSASDESIREVDLGVHEKAIQVGATQCLRHVFIKGSGQVEIAWTIAATICEPQVDLRICPILGALLGWTAVQRAR